MTLEAAEPGLRITTATAHLLGALRWLGRAEAGLVLAGGSAACHCPITGENPLVGLADLARAPGGRLGVIEAERIMVHDAMGVSGHSIEHNVVFDVCFYTGTLILVFLTRPFSNYTDNVFQGRVLLDSKPVPGAR